MNLAYIPSPTFSKFEIGPFTIHMYAICILIGICVAVWILATRWKRYGGTFDQILDTTLVTVPLRTGGRAPLPTASPRRPTTSRPPATWSTSSRCGKAAWPSSAASPSAPWWRSCGAVTSTIRSRSSPTPSPPRCPWPRPSADSATGSTKSSTVVAHHAAVGPEAQRRGRHRQIRNLLFWRAMPGLQGPRCSTRRSCTR